MPAEKLQRIARAGVVLALFAAIGAAIVAATYSATRDRIADNEHRFILRSLNALVAEGSYDNDLANDTIEVIDPELLGSDKPVTVYRARRNGQPVALILSPVAPDGYGGPINLLVGINADGILKGVRVVAHRETPGLGDAIDIDRSDWLLSFDKRSLTNTSNKAWAVRRDGGEFDQFTGATITPRAVVNAVHNALLYFETNRDALFDQATEE